MGYLALYAEDGYTDEVAIADLNDALENALAAIYWRGKFG